jgi:hypothetical protein
MFQNSITNSMCYMEQKFSSTSTVESIIQPSTNYGVAIPVAFVFLRSG